MGPDFGLGRAGRPAAYLAESILNPHRLIAGEERRWRAEDGRASRLTDHTEVITLRELVDGTAYIRSIR